ncbi:MAG: SGNH/GDSL hydrolase family protein [Flaviflexus sp.]|uniref:SGNH/GDSL hydrolase family protein n=1 Tax=Flaviflexus sp. TaxID=1969482 RepID=UPI00352DEF68
MNGRSRETAKSIVLLAALAVMAIVLSYMALTSTGATVSSSETNTPTVNTESSPTDTQSEPEVNESPSEEATEEPSEAPTEPQVTVVIIGDTYSINDSPENWINPVAEELGWNIVSNLSAPGRGFVTLPRSCDNSPCEAFPGTVDAVVESQPEVVVTFGGSADGDIPIGGATDQYFQDLRAALPDAQIIALSPISSADTLPDWIPFHVANVRASVESVGGIYVDLGQPALGDGEALSAESQAEIAQAVVATLNQ